MAERCRHPSAWRFWLWHCLFHNWMLPCLTMSPSLTLSCSEDLPSLAFTSQKSKKLSLITSSKVSKSFQGDALWYFPVADLTCHAPLRQPCALKVPQKWKIMSYSKLDTIPPQKNWLILIGYVLAQFQAAGFAQSSSFFFNRFWWSFVPACKNCLYYPENRSNWAFPDLIRRKH